LHGREQERRENGALPGAYGRRYEARMPLVTDAPLTPRELLDECLDFKRAHPVASRFLAALLDGRLSERALRAWAMDMYHYVQPAIPSLTAWLARTPTLIDREAARLLGRNLAGEMGFLREADHRDLYLRLLAALGVREDEARDHLPLPTTIGAAAVLGWFCRSSFEEGLGAFGLGIELQVPGRPNGAALIAQALRRRGIPEDALEFYAIHVEAEEEHGANAEGVLAAFAQTREQQALVRRAFQWTVRATQGMQQGFDAYLADG
jgi:pyrroloquinoline quinone (PQQ) biosynthesis protein C